jgi:hypothetical protein
MNAHQRGTVEPVKLHPKWGRTPAETAQPSHMGSRWAASEGDQQDTGSLAGLLVADIEFAGAHALAYASVLLGSPCQRCMCSASERT